VAMVVARVSRDRPSVSTTSMRSAELDDRAPKSESNVDVRIRFKPIWVSEPTVSFELSGETKSPRTRATYAA
jgi:hypothetical protein